MENVSLGHEEQAESILVPAALIECFPHDSPLVHQDKWLLNISVRSKKDEVGLPSNHTYTTSKWY
jgi:hypothetical protein